MDRMLLLVVILGNVCTIIGCILFYKDYVNFKYSKQANEMVSKPKTVYKIPGTGFFTTREKRKALVNNDEKAYIIEKNNHDQETRK